MTTYVWVTIRFPNGHCSRYKKSVNKDKNIKELEGQNFLDGRILWAEKPGERLSDTLI